MLYSASASGPAKPGNPILEANVGIYSIGRNAPRATAMFVTSKIQNGGYLRKDTSGRRNIRVALVGSRFFTRAIAVPTPMSYDGSVSKAASTMGLLTLMLRRTCTTAHTLSDIRAPYVMSSQSRMNGTTLPPNPVPAQATPYASPLRRTNLVESAIIHQCEMTIKTTHHSSRKTKHGKYAKTQPIAYNTPCVAMRVSTLVQKDAATSDKQARFNPIAILVRRR